MQIVGKEVKFYYKQQWHHGTIIKLNPTKAKVQVEGGKTWNVPYDMLHEEGEYVNPFTAMEDKRLTHHYNFAIGDRVSFQLKNGAWLHGTVNKINSKTFGIKCDNGQGWRVGGSLLTKVH